MTICKCVNCGHACPQDDLEQIKHFWERIEPGDEVPAGECPKCGALSYLHSFTPTKHIDDFKGAEVYNSCEGPFRTMEDAIDFGDAEISSPWRTVRGLDVAYPWEIEIAKEKKPSEPVDGDDCIVITVEGGVVTDVAIPDKYPKLTYRINDLDELEE